MDKTRFDKARKALQNGRARIEKDTLLINRFFDTATDAQLADVLNVMEQTTNELLDSVAESCDKWGAHEDMIATISVDSRIAVLAFLSLRRMVAQHTVNRLERHVGMGAN